MPMGRRDLLRVGALAAARTAAGAPVRKKILILGGTGFLGPATVEAAMARGHEITLFNRGRTRPGLFPGVEKLHGDRDPRIGDGIRALEGREWDAVIDNSGFFPRIVSASARLLAPRVKRYVFISSISVYAENGVEGADETARLATMADPTVEDMGKDSENYGALKALCERAAEEAMPGRVAVVRPGFIVGPDDPSGRFTYWPVRIDRGGEVLAPGAPGDPVQFVDVRDLGEWLVRVAEDGATGIFNATGPQRRLAWGKLLEACRDTASAPGKLTWVNADFLELQKGVNFPIWVPYRGETLGFHAWKIDRALAAGLRFRPYAATVEDTLAWYKSQPRGGRVKLAGPPAQREAEVLAAWKKRGT
jgi:2'-hydroxyisoflavone reductase